MCVFVFVNVHVCMCGWVGLRLPVCIRLWEPVCSQRTLMGTFCRSSLILMGFEDVSPSLVDIIKIRETAV